MRQEMREWRLQTAPRGEARLDDLHAQFRVEVAKAEELRPHAVVGHQRVDADVGAHAVELRAEHRAAADLLPASRHQSATGVAVPCVQDSIQFLNCNLFHVNDLFHMHIDDAVTLAYPRLPVVYGKLFQAGFELRELCLHVLHLHRVHVVAQALVLVLRRPMQEQPRFAQPRFFAGCAAVRCATRRASAHAADGTARVPRSIVTRLLVGLTAWPTYIRTRVCASRCSPWMPTLRRMAAPLIVLKAGNSPAA